MQSTMHERRFPHCGNQRDVKRSRRAAEEAAARLTLEHGPRGSTCRLRVHPLGVLELVNPQLEALAAKLHAGNAPNGSSVELGISPCPIRSAHPDRQKPRLLIRAHGYTEITCAVRSLG